MAVKENHTLSAACTSRPRNTTRYTDGWCLVMSIVVWRSSLASGMRFRMLQ